MNEHDYLDWDWADDGRDDEVEHDGQPDEMLEWEGLADAGFGTDEDYGYFGEDD
jgi:hypothetical protein